MTITEQAWEMFGVIVWGVLAALALAAVAHWMWSAGRLFLKRRISEMTWNWDTPMEDLVGRTMKSVLRNEEAILFETVEGQKYSLHHDQDCCERVTIEDVCGDLSDLVASPIIKAAAVGGDRPALDGWDESFTWTFFDIATAKGAVTIRFYGTSNGYYGESASLHKLGTEEGDAR